MNIIEDPIILFFLAAVPGMLLLIVSVLFVRQRRLINRNRPQVAQLASVLEQSLLPNASAALELPPLDHELASLASPINQLLAAHANQEHDRYQILKELARGLNHNMNNLLFGILGAAQLIERHSDNVEIQSWAKVAYTDGKKLTDLVAQLTEAVTEQLDPTPGDIDLNQTIKTLLDNSQSRWLKTAAANNQQIRFRTELANPCALIRSNPGSIAHMIEQLLQNAVDAMRTDGTITIRTFQPNPQEVSIEVRDDGIGMTGDTRRRIFDPFFTTKKALGTGLGLSKVMTIVLQWEGTVAVTSEAGKGTSFVVTFPAIDAPAETPVNDLSPRHARVLVVDDQEAIGVLIASALNDNFEVTVFQDAESAIRAFQPGLWEIAMIDLDLPGTSGDQLANRLREHDADIIRILMTGWALESNDPRRDSFEYHLRKPVTDINVLNTLISDALHNAKRRATQT